MTIEQVLEISSEIKKALQNTVDILGKYEGDISAMNPDDFTQDEIEQIEKENDEIDILLERLKKYW